MPGGHAFKAGSFGSSFGLIGAIELREILEANSYGACLRWQLAPFRMAACPLLFLENLFNVM